MNQKEKTAFGLFSLFANFEKIKRTQGVREQKNCRMVASICNLTFDPKKEKNIGYIKE